MKLLSFDELLSMPADRLRQMKRDARELLSIVECAGFGRDDIGEARRELPRFVKQIERALSIKKQGEVQH